MRHLCVLSVSMYSGFSGALPRQSDFVGRGYSTAVRRCLVGNLFLSDKHSWLVLAVFSLDACCLDVMAPGPWPMVGALLEKGVFIP